MQAKIQKMFDSIAKHYDLLNTLLSLGLHKKWKKRIASYFTNSNSYKILDIATGSGDIAIILKKKLGDKADITGLDFSSEMIKIAHTKAQKLNLNINFIEADAKSLPFPDKQFDYVTIAFGIRNIPEILPCLNEISRVLKHNGGLIILEFGMPSKPFLLVYKLYNKIIIPLLGFLITRNFNAYKYLADTSINYPSGNDFLKILHNTGIFKSLNYKPLAFGVAYLYFAELNS